MIKTGRHGQVKLDGVVIANLSNWKLSVKQALIDVSHFGNDGWDEVVAGNCSFEGSFEGSYDKADTNGQMAIQEAIVSGQDLDIDFIIDKNDETDKYTGKVKIETIDIDTSPKEVIKISVKFKGNGALTFPTQAE
jgi:predicted secreted protein